jgi:hypothetical protein
MWGGFLGVGLAANAWGLFVTPEIYKRSKIYEPILALAPLPVWGALWAGAALAAVVASVTAWPHPWLIAKVAAAGLGAAWLGALSWGHFIDGHDIAWTGFATWWWWVASNGMVLGSRRQFRPALGGCDGRFL